MRSEYYLGMDYWTSMCNNVYGLDMSSYPQVSKTIIDQGGLNIGAQNVIFANGGEDPWKWATRMYADESKNQVAFISDCNDCGHCVELYTPDISGVTYEPKELMDTR
jgi:hypothetical protein